MTAPADLSDHPGVAAVLTALGSHGIVPEVRYLPDAVRTAVAAADALGITPSEIANSLVFAATTPSGDTIPVLILASGGHRVDTAAVAESAGLTSLTRATPEFVRTHTGMAIGGVAPVGHPAPIRTLVDTDLDRFDQVWAAAGHSHAVFATTFADLVRMTGGEPMAVA